MSNNILEPIPASLNDYLLKYSTVTLSNTTPAALPSTSNVTFQKDGFGNISACVAGGGGGGGVSTVSVVTANGVSGTVANPTTTPAITLVLGDITPSNVTVPSGGVFRAGYQSSAVAISDIGAGFSAITLNSQLGFGTTLGMYAANTGIGDNNLYFNTVDNTGGFIFRVNAVQVAGIDGSGVGTFSKLALTSPVIATSATAGAATALPATPLGYVTVTITISGTPTAVKIPYYAV